MEIICSPNIAFKIFLNHFYCVFKTLYTNYVRTFSKLSAEIHLETTGNLVQTFSQRCGWNRHVSEPVTSVHQKQWLQTLKKNTEHRQKSPELQSSLGGTARWLQLQPSSPWPRQRKRSKMFSLCATRITRIILLGCIWILDIHFKIVVMLRRFSVLAGNSWYTHSRSPADKYAYRLCDCCQVWYV